MLPPLIDADAALMTEPPVSNKTPTVPATVGAKHSSRIIP
jgi:hypothetical protein